MIGYRLLAFFVDFWIVNILGFVLTTPYWAYVLNNHPNYIHEYLLGANFLIIFLYFFLFEFIWRKTPGKAILKIKVVSETNSIFWFFKIFVRTLSRFIPLEPLSFVLFKNEFFLHDKLSKTKVIKN